MVRQHPFGQQLARAAWRRDFAKAQMGPDASELAKAVLSDHPGAVDENPEDWADDIAQYLD